MNLTDIDCEMCDEAKSTTYCAGCEEFLCGECFAIHMALMCEEDGCDD